MITNGEKLYFNKVLNFSFFLKHHAVLFDDWISLLTTYQPVTDGQTDRQTDGIAILTVC